MTVLKIILIVAFLAALPIGLVAACGRSLLYYPTRLGPAELGVLAARPGWSSNVLDHDGVRLNGLVRAPSDPAARWVAFFGGNAMGLAAGQSILTELAGNEEWGLALWAYRGYDGSEGRPTEAGLLSDAEAAIDHLERRFGVSPDRLVLVGQSLGSGVAAHAAASLGRRGSPAAGLILLSPYTSIAQVADDSLPIVPVGWAMPDTYRTDLLLDDIPGPVLIVHGTADTLIRLDHGEALARGLGDRAELHTVSGAGHNDLWDHDAAVRRMREFINGRQLDSPPAAVPDEY